MEKTETCPLIESRSSGISVSDISGKVQRTIGVLGAIGILFGNTVGAGIFISPKGIYAHAGSAGAGLLVWVFAGLTCGMASFAYTELGTMIQESGGEMVYVNKAFGRYLAFLTSFVLGCVVRPAVSAVAANILSEYLYCAVTQHDVVTRQDQLIVACIAIAACVLCTILCTCSVRITTAVCGVFSVCKMLAITFLVVCGVCILARKEGHVENFTHAFEGSSTNPASYGSAILFSSLAYNSWNSLNTMTGEIIKPSKTMPIASITAMGLVTLFYTLSNISYLMIFTVDQIIETNTIAMDAGVAAFGYVGKLGMCLGLLCSCGGCLLGGLFMLARILQSTADKGLFPSPLSYISPYFNTPIAAQIFAMLLTIMYTLVDVNTLIPCMTSVEWATYSLTFAAFLKFRYTEKDMYRPIKVWLALPIYLMLISISFVIIPLGSTSTRMPVVYGYGFLVVGTVLYGVQELVNYCTTKKTV